MGFAQFMERKAQQEILKRALDAEMTAGCCLGMVVGPAIIMMEMGQPAREEVHYALDGFLDAWQRVRQLSDRNLERNRPYYTIQPNVRLSPLLEKFERELWANRADDKSEPAEIVARVKDAYMEETFGLFEFHRWAVDQAAPMIGLDLAAYEPKAAKRAQRVWEPAVRAMTAAMDD